MKEMLRKHANDFLALRTLRGYQDADWVWLIRDYLKFLDQEQLSTITMANALRFACLPDQVSAQWGNSRLSVVRLFASHIHAEDPDLAELIPPGLLPARGVRVTPYLYSSEEIGSLIMGARNLAPELRGLTLAAIIGLMSATGIRTVEALSLEVSDINIGEGTILVNGKGSKQRLIPVHETTLKALDAYLADSRAVRASPDGALFMNSKGTRPVANTVQQAFRKVVRGCSLRSAPGTREPRLYDLRHTFAVNTLIDAHRSEVGIDARIAALATYLGHGSPIHTYWYLSASPQLLHIVSDRIEKHFQGDPS